VLWVLVYLLFLRMYTNVYSIMWCPGQNKRLAPLTFFHGGPKRPLKDLKRFHHDCNQTVIGYYNPVSFPHGYATLVKCGRLEGILKDFIFVQTKTQLITKGNLLHLSLSTQKMDSKFSLKLRTH
jgi:hypothetical protein